jgi:MFS family permease
MREATSPKTVRSPADERARRNFQPVVLGQAVSLFGDYIAYFTLPWLIVTMTGRPQDLGLTAAAETLPLLLFGFFAGVILDRKDIRRILIAADGFRAVIFLLLALAVAADWVEPWIVFLAAFGVGSFSVFFDAGLNALLPSVVGEELLVEANARMSVARNVAWTFGPAIGGLIVAQSGDFAPAFVLNAATFVVSGALLLRVRELHATEKARTPDLKDALLRGLKFIAKQPHLRWATLGAAGTNFLFAPLEALLVLFVSDRLADSMTLPGVLDDWFQGAAEVGLFLALQAAIGAVGVIAAPRLVTALGLGRMYVIGLVMLGGGFFIVAGSSSFWAVIPAGIALTGVGWVNVAFITMRQRLTPDRLLGRVMAATRTISYLLIPLGAAAGGFLAESIGLVAIYRTGAFIVGGLAIVLAVGPLGRQAVPDGVGAEIELVGDAE